MRSLLPSINLLLRPGMLTLFDNEYMIVADENGVEVSRRICEDYENGREFYAYHGKNLQYLQEHYLDPQSADYLL